MFFLKANIRLMYHKIYWYKEGMSGSNEERRMGWAENTYPFCWILLAGMLHKKPLAYLCQSFSCSRIDWEGSFIQCNFKDVELFALKCTHFLKHFLNTVWNNVCVNLLLRLSSMNYFHNLIETRAIVVVDNSISDLKNRSQWLCNN